MNIITKKKLLFFLSSILIGAAATSIQTRMQIEQGKNMCSDLVIQSELMVFRNPEYKVGELKFLTCRDYVYHLQKFQIKSWIIYSLLLYILIITLEYSIYKKN